MFDGDILQLMTWAFAAGGGAVGVKIAFNGNSKKITSIESDLKKHIKEESRLEKEVAERLVRVETKQEVIAQNIERLLERR